MQHIEIFESLLDELFRSLERFAGDVLECKATERESYSATDARTVHIDQFERTAAKVADNAVRFMDSGHNAERSEMRLTLSREDCDLVRQMRSASGDEGTAIARVPAGGRGDDPDRRTCKISHKARKRRSASNAVSMASAGNRPVDCT